MDYRQHAFEIFDFQILHLQLNTPLFILALLLIVMASLHVLLFRPVLRTLDGRQAELTKLDTETRQQQAELARLAEQYRKDLDQARAQVDQTRSQAHAEARKRYEELLDQARKAAGKELQAALAELQAEMKGAASQLSRAARTLAQQATQRMLSA
jgi:F0F1-type ATP synthase membrane subunit b/b'